MASDDPLEVAARLISAIVAGDVEGRLEEYLDTAQIAPLLRRRRGAGQT